MRRAGGHDDLDAPHPAAAGELPVLPGVSGLALMAEAGFSTVYRGELDRTQAPVVVKVLPMPLDRDTREQFDADRTRLGRLQHVPSILQVDDVDALPDGRPYLVSELCADSVAALLARGERLDGEEVAAVGSAAAAGLAAAHGAGVLHGRLTPANLLVRSTGQPVLADFGLALRRRYPGDPTDAGEYTAPETLRDGTITERSDLYGLGATLYAALTGRPPFPSRVGEHPSERVLRVLRQAPPPVGEDAAPVELAALLADLLATEPGERPAGAAEVATRFEALLAARPEAEPADGLLAELESTEQSLGGSAPPPAPLPAPRPGPLPAAGPGPLPAARSAPLPAPAPAPDPTPVAEPDAPAGWSDLLGDEDGDEDGEPRDAQRAERVRRRAVLGAKVAAAVLVAVAGVLLTRQIGTEPSAAPPAPPAADRQSGAATAPPTVQLTSVRVVDRGRKVTLTWQGPPGMSYAVIVAAAGQPTPAARLVDQAKTRTFTIVPGGQYCFQVQGTFDGVRAVQSAPKGINGATCQG